MGARVFQGQIRPDTRFDKLATSESDGSGSSKPPASASIMRTAGQALRGRAVALSDCQRLYTSTPKYLISKPDLCITVADNVQRQAHSEVLNGVSSTAKPLLSLRQLREQALDLPNVEVEGLDVLLCYLYSVEPGSLFFGMEPFLATQQLVQLIEELGASRTISLDCEAALLSEHYAGNQKTGSAVYGQKCLHGNGTTYYSRASYDGSGLFTEENVLMWAGLADAAGFDLLAEQCGKYIYSNGSKMQRDAVSLGPLVMQGLLSFCHSDDKREYFWENKAMDLAKERGNKFTPTKF